MNRNTTIFLNFVLVGCLGLFLWWAEGSLDGYKIQILNLIAVNIIWRFPSISSTASPACSAWATQGSWPSAPMSVPS